jgi:hypothetical protein
MKYFPTLCVDDFFDTPHRVREFALRQKYETTSNMWAGARTDEIFNLDKQLFEMFSHKVISLFMDTDDVDSLTLSARFQKIPRISTVHPELNQGWVHDDGENVFAGLVYLNPDPNPNSGTSMFSLKPETAPFDPELSEIKRSLYDGTLDDHSKAVAAIAKHNDKFVETAKFNNVFNRLVCYDASVFHKANSYDNDDDRLTLVFFLKEISAKSIPILRSRKYAI